MRPFTALMVLFIAVPIVEIFVLVEIGRVIGSLATLFFLIFTAVLGAMLVRMQGLNTLWNIQQELDAGRLPAAKVVEGVIIIFAGALLLTPGFVTDAVGFVCLIPQFRRRLITAFLHRQGAATIHARRPGEPFQQSGRDSDPHRGRVIEGEFEDEPRS